MATILLTGTIAPSPKLANLQVTDIEIRYHQYIHNIIYYLSVDGIDNVIFSENSWYPIKDKWLLSQVAKYYWKELEIIQFQWDIDGIIAYWRWYGEQEILEYTLKNSHILSQSKHFFKVTWRYLIHNLSEVIQACNISQSKNFFVVMSPWERRCSTAFFACSTDFFQTYLWWCGHNIDDKKWEMHQIEWVYYTILKHTKKYIQSFPILPIFSAHTWSGYTLTPNTIKDYIKKICNVLGLYTI